MTALAIVMHGGEGHSELVYFWSAVLIAFVPVTLFATMSVLLIRSYRHRREADGGGEPPRDAGSR